MTCHLQKVLLAVVGVASIGLSSLPMLAGQLLTEGESLRLGLARPEVAGLARGRIGEADALEAGLWANPTLDHSRDKARSGTAAPPDLPSLLPHPAPRRVRSSASFFSLHLERYGHICCAIRRYWS